MKRSIIFIILLFFAGTVYANWTVTENLCTVKTFPNATHVYIAVTSDGNAQSSTLNLFSLIPEKEQARLRTGGIVYGIFSIPDISSTWPISHTADAPTAAYAFTLSDELGSTLSFTAQSYTATNDALTGDDTDTGLYFMANSVLNFTTTYAGASGDTFFIVLVIL